MLHNNARLKKALKEFIDLPTGTQIEFGLCAWLADYDGCSLNRLNLPLCGLAEEFGLTHPYPGCHTYDYVDVPGVVTERRKQFAAFVYALVDQYVRN